MTRYVTAQPAVWASEVAAIAFAWLTFFGASACFRYNAHPSIDMLVQRCRPRRSAWCAWASTSWSPAFLGYFCWMGVELLDQRLGQPDRGAAGADDGGLWADHPGDGDDAGAPCGEHAPSVVMPRKGDGMNAAHAGREAA